MFRLLLAVGLNIAVPCLVTGLRLVAAILAGCAATLLGGPLLGLLLLLVALFLLQITVRYSLAALDPNLPASLCCVQQPPSDLVRNWACRESAPRLCSRDDLLFNDGEWMLPAREPQPGMNGPIINKQDRSVCADHAFKDS